MAPPSPDRCLLCHGPGPIAPAGFTQLYPQGNGSHVPVRWWECPACRGWFASPVPTVEQIRLHWESATAAYNRPEAEVSIARNKEALYKELLATLAGMTERGPLLDYGCNFGQFLLRARAEGWQASGFEPSAVAAEGARAKGFEVRCGWDLMASEINASLAALSVIDVFYYVWHPWETLRAFHECLRPGGVLVMRVSNKRRVLGLVRSATRRGERRDRTLTRLLQSQFHSVSASTLASILRSIGFTEVRVVPGARTVEWEDAALSTKVAYAGAGFLRVLSGGRWNLSPGVLVYAKRP